MSNGIALSTPTRTDPLDRELARVEDELILNLGGGANVLQAVVKGALHAGGKRMRPRMMLLSAAACGADASTLARCRRFAVAVEYLHTATLLHDDLVDDASLRRGQATAHIRYGAKKAVLAGDLLFARCLSLMAEADLTEPVRILAQATERMAVGEAMEIELTRRPEVSEEEYFVFAAAKTAPLFSAAAELGAVLTGAPDRVRAALVRYGEAVGTAFQVTDDILDVTAPTERSGKERGTDLRGGVSTLPVLKALAVLAGTPHELEIRKVLTGDCLDSSRALQLVREHGVAPAKLSAYRLVNDARQALCEVAPSPAVDALRTLAKTAVDRLS